MLLSNARGLGLAPPIVARSSESPGTRREQSWVCRSRLAAGLLLALAGCTQMMSRTAAPPLLPPLAVPMSGGTAPGSLWRANQAGSYPFLDVRPRFPGDLLTVVIAEDAQGKKDADTTLESGSSVSGSVEEFFGIPSFGNLEPSNLVTAESKRSFDGEGETTRKASLTGKITVTVTAVEPNGNLHIEGQKVVSLNNEEEYIVLRGVVRPEDIGTNNEVSSWRLADARIEFYGSGVVANQQRPGFIYTGLDWLWPF